MVGSEEFEVYGLTPLSMIVGQSGCYRSVVSECGLIINECGFGSADIIHQCGLANHDVIGPARLYYRSATLMLIENDPEAPKRAKIRLFA